MKILCATDFSERARAAARAAVDLARATAGSLELLHVVPSRAEDVLAESTDARVLDDEIRRNAAARLEAERRELEPGQTTVTAAVGAGHFESVLLARARAIGADLIVLGADGRPALEKLVLGSAAERVVRRADRPVLIVPAGSAPPGPHPPGAAPLGVMVALDGRTASDGAVEFVRALRVRVPLDVTFLRLYFPIEEYARLGLIGPRDLFGPDPDVVADLTRSLSAEIGVLPGAGQTSLAIEPTWGDPAGRILEAARQRGVGLIVMGTESRRGLARLAHPPVARRVARHASGIPVVFAPHPAGAAAPARLPGIFTVLAPTDLSPEGNAAVRHAYALLAGHGGVVELCHVHQRFLPMPAYAYDPPQGKLGDADRARLEAELRALVPAEAERLGITTHVTVIDGGKAGEAIVQAAERMAVDAIVLGSHGHGRAHRSLMGSVSERVVRHGHRPVLVVPRPNKEPG